MACVRPGVFGANGSRFCCVSVLMQVDLPALERPTKAISGTSATGRNSSRGAVVRKRAVCSQPTASAAGEGVEGLVPGVEVMECGRKAEWGIVESRGFAPSKLQYRDQVACFPA